MANTEMETKFYENIAQIFGKKPEELSRETRFVEDLHSKSQLVWAVAAVMEQLAGASVTYADANNFKTLGEALDHIEELKG